jgi:glycosyltransferase involved in cell wall biosynthesis
MKVLTVIDWPAMGWIWRYLPPSDDRYDFYELRHPRPPRAEWMKPLLYYPGHLLGAPRLWGRLQDYDAVVTWEAKCGLPVALYQTLTRQCRPPHVLLGLILKSGLIRWPWLFRPILASVSRVVCFTRYEARACVQVLGLPREKVRFLHLGWDNSLIGQGDNLPKSVDGDYILSVGSSNRDYATLADAVKGLLAHVLVVAHPYGLRGITFPPNVEVRYSLPGYVVTELIAGARLVVIPLFGTGYASGQLVLLRAMAFGKPVVVTRTPGVIDYVDDGKTARFVEPGDSEGLRQALRTLLDSPAERARLGANALRIIEERFAVAIFARKVATVVREAVCESRSAPLPR